jgi:hypothetical protein
VGVDHAELVARNVGSAYEDADAAATLVHVEKLIGRTQQELGFERSAAEKIIGHWLADRFWLPPGADGVSPRFATEAKALGDLRQALGLGRAPRFMREHAVGLVTVAGVVASALTAALFSTTYSQFYDQLGVRPDEVGVSAGLGPQATLVPAVAFVVAASVLLLCAVAPAIAVVFHDTNEKRRPQPRELLEFAALMALAGYAFYTAHDDAPELFEAVIVDPLALVALVLGVPVAVAGWRTFRQEAPLLGLNQEAATTAIGLAPFASVFMLGLALTNLADSRADRVLAGEPVDPVALGGLRIFDVRADRASLVFAGAPPPGLERSTCAVYLGQSEGQHLVIIDGRLLRVPKERVFVETDASGDVC